MPTVAHSTHRQQMQRAPLPHPTVPTLLVLGNFFPEGKRALSLAAELAEPLNAPLVLLHVAPRAEATSEENPAATRALRRDLQQLTRELGRPATIELVAAPLRLALQEVAQRHAPALFVLGRPAAVDADFELGLTVIDELRAAHLPLLLVPEVYAGPDVPQHLAVASDDEPFALHAGARAAQVLLRGLQLPQVTVITASPLQDDAVCQAALHHVRRSGLLPAHGAHASVEGFYAMQTEQGLLHALATLQADWLVLLARPRHFLDKLLHRSVTKRMLRWSPVPVLVVPSRAARFRLRGDVASLGCDLL